MGTFVVITEPQLIRLGEQVEREYRPDQRARRYEVIAIALNAVAFSPRFLVLREYREHAREKRFFQIEVQAKDMNLIILQRYGFRQ